MAPDVDVVAGAFTDPCVVRCDAQADTVGLTNAYSYVGLYSTVMFP